MTRATRGPLPWAAVERVYVSTDVPVTQIARISAIPLGVLRDEIKRRGWTRKQSPAALISFETTSALAARLGRLARHQLAMLERQLTRTRPDEHANSRRLSAATALARLIECMAKVENKEPGR